MAVKYNLPPTAYTPAGLTMIHPDLVADAGKEYQRLRRVAEKRLARLKNSEFASGETYRRNKQGFTGLSAIKTNRQLGEALYQVHRFLDAKTSTISGQKAIREKILETLHEKSYTFVTEENLEDFGRFMEAARIAAGGKLKASDRVAELYDAARRKSIDPMALYMDFNYWKDNIDVLNRAKIIEGEGVTVEQYKRRVASIKGWDTRRRKRD